MKRLVTGHVAYTDFYVAHKGEPLSVWRECRSIEVATRGRLREPIRLACVRMPEDYVPVLRHKGRYLPARSQRCAVKFRHRHRMLLALCERWRFPHAKCGVRVYRQQVPSVWRETKRGTAAPGELAEAFP